MIAEGAKLKVIITGATGMVGEGVLFECLEHPAIAGLAATAAETPAQTPERTFLVGLDQRGLQARAIPVGALLRQAVRQSS